MCLFFVIATLIKFHSRCCAGEKAPWRGAEHEDVARRLGEQGDFFLRQTFPEVFFGRIATHKNNIVAAGEVAFGYDLLSQCDSQLLTDLTSETSKRDS